MKNLRNKIKNMEGITLVALVITIIILIILARSNSKLYNRKERNDRKSKYIN